MMIDPNDPEIKESLKYLQVSQQERLEMQSRAFDSKVMCWIPDEKEGYAAAQITGTKGDMTEVKVISSGQARSVKTDLVEQMNPPKFEKCDDMADLTFLNDPAVLNNLKDRYKSFLIYTYSGLFCVVINPYKRLPIYTDKIVAMYRGKKRNEVPPHLFAVADNAYANMLRGDLLGESGAGKTENTKKVIQYFATVAATSEKKSDQPNLEDQIVSANPLMESYGNAKTTRNNNSSRFGKFIRIHFGSSGKIAGADIATYLLEKARVIFQQKAERNYHIFYQLTSSAATEYQKLLLIEPDPSKYEYVSQGCLKVDGIDDCEEMKATLEACRVLNFTKEETDNMLKCTGSLMHFGNSKWKQRPREEQAELDGGEECEKVAFLLGVEAADLIKSLLKPRIKVGNEYVNKGQNKDQVVYAIGALSKSIYERLFNWMLVKINQTLDVKTSRQYFIGVLDIAGFEIFEYNGFEQLCINFTNEMLQQFFNHHMFVLEQEEYKKEGIQWEFIDFGLDLQACIDLIEKPMGILSMLEEECIVPKGSDKGFVDKLANVHFGKHPNITAAKAEKGKPQAHFVLKHYAGSVPYSVEGWLEKNKDPINNSVAQLFANSKNPVLAYIFKDYLATEEKSSAKGGRSKKGGSMQTISAMHRDQLATLMMHLRSTHPHFVRCIIPNENKQAGELDAFLVLNQLHCNGVLEGIRICRKGFPNRMIYSEFKQRYSILAPNVIPKGFVDAKKATVDILATVDLSKELYKVGNTKIFFKSGVLAQLEDLRDAALSIIVTKLQGRIRSYVMKIMYRRMAEQKLALDILQRNCFKYLAFRNWPWWKLYTKVKPMLSVARQEEDMKKLQDDFDKMKEQLANEEALRKKFEEQSARLTKEKNDINMELEHERTNTAEAQDRAEKLIVQKSELESRIADINERLEEEEDNAIELSRKKRNLEDELDLKNTELDELKTNIQKLQGESKNKDSIITKYQSENTQIEDQIAKLSRDKKRIEQELSEMSEKLQSEEDKSNGLNKVKSKLEQNLDELEHALDQEKKARVELEKSKRKLETDLKASSSSIEDMQRMREEMETTVRNKDQEISSTYNQLEDEQRQVSTLSKKMKEMQAKIDELEEEIEMERQARSKAERQRQDLSRELEDVGDRLEQVGGSSVAQTELAKKRESELMKLRRDLDEASVQHESAIVQLKKKHQDAVNEMGQQIEQLQKLKVKLDKDKNQLSSENSDLKMQLDQVFKSKTNAERLCKQLEQQLSDVTVKLESGQREIDELNTSKSRLIGENNEFAQQIEDLEHNLGALNKTKQHLQSELSVAQAQVDEESRAKSALTAQLRNVTADLDNITDQLEQEIESKSELDKTISRLNSEVSQWKTRYETEGLARAEELEDAKRKLSAKLSETEDQVEQALSKCLSLEKVKQRLQGEVEDLIADVERANNTAMSLEKKQKQFDKLINDWKKKCDDVSLELEASQKEARSYSSELFKLKGKFEECEEEIESLKKDNKNLSDEIRDLLDESSEGARNIHEITQEKKRIEAERNDLQMALEEAEATIEHEEAQVVRLQMEISTVRQEVDRRLREKDEEFESTRRNHQRVVESIQATLDSEMRAKQESIRQKKKLESDVNELEVTLDHANRSISDQQKSINRLETQLKESHEEIEEEQRKRDEAREAASNAERRLNMIVNEIEEIRIKYDQTDAARRSAENDLMELSERVGELTTLNSNLGSQKKQLENTIGTLQSDLDEAISELRDSEEKAKQANVDAARLVEELRSEQEHSLAQEAVRKSLDQQLKTLQGRFDEMEANAIKGGKKIIQRLEEKIHAITEELEIERNNAQEAIKQSRKNERKAKEFGMQLEENHRNQLRLQETLEKLQSKIKVYKRQVEEAEEIAALNLSKYRKTVQELEAVQERADSNESMINKLRAKNRDAGMAPMSQDAISSRETSRAPFTRGTSVRR